MENQSYQISKDVIARRNQDGTVILMKMDESSLFYKIDGMAAAVWNEMQTPKSVGELITKFGEQNIAHRESLQKDIPSFVQDLFSKKLLSQSDN